MPKSLQLNIAEPCHENWQNMTPQEQGRFCGACQKTVVDFTKMSDQEVLNYFLKADHNVCGRFADDQLNKELIITEKKKRFSWAYVWNILVATLLAVKADAQACPPIKKPVEPVKEVHIKVGKVAYVPPANSGKPGIISGTVIDETNNQPVGGVSISIKDAGIVSIANTTGKFNLKLENKGGLQLEFSAVGYETTTLVVDELANMQDLQISLKRSQAELKEVVVVAGVGYTRKGYTNCGYRITTGEKILRNLPAVLKNDVKVYPNPVVRGNSITVSLSLKQAGAYKLEVLNAAGQVMQVQPLLMQTKEQVIDLHTQVAWSAGIYWLRISSPNTKSVYQSKLLVK
ncbi:carboxypeptidase-like regulatory domain-containing protein [Niastella sp. OAS944]|uniref:carboxypeptidase-like regulatory domain-containing protein n=1 Tax=Niastella sp. OAS944 TaxID=2664089 RepID=UPI0034837586|nr:transcriptional regulator NrdR family protein [Chitinophagaceae bacterium OAS944]